MMIGNYSSIKLYAQLVLVEEIRPKPYSLRLSADAASGTIGCSLLSLATVPTDAIVSFNEHCPFSGNHYTNFDLP